MILLALLAAIQGNDIVVTGAREKAVRRVAKQVEAVLPPLAFDRPYARFERAVCPGVSGLEPASAQAVVDRIGVIAASVGLKVGEPGCTANLLVIVAADGAAAVRRAYPRAGGAFVSQSLADIRRIIAEPGTARGWSEITLYSRDGEPLVASPNEPPILNIQGPSRLVLPYRREIVSSVVVIDQAAARGRDVRQIADYAAMRGLADARPGSVRGAETVLSAFGKDDATAPKGLTAFDRGLLAGLYKGQANYPSLMKRVTIADAILDAK